ncbi:FTR1 family protein [Rhodococcus aerolatus]
MQPVGTVLVTNGLIGLREGLETGIVVMILVAFLVRSDRRDALRWVWTGVGAALLLIAAVFTVVHHGTSTLSFTAQETIGGTASVVAAVIVTGMVLWMRRAARTISGTLRSGMTAALDVGPLAVVGLAFLAVAREGAETALLLLSNVENTGSTATPLVGLLLGVLVAVGLTVAMYLGAVTLDLARFFRVTGVLLVLVAAGILAYGVHDLQEAGLLSGGSTLAFDLSATIDPGAWYAVLVGGILNLRPAMTVLEVAAWAGYVVVVLGLFLRPARRAATPSPTPTTAGTSS